MSLSNRVSLDTDVIFLRNIFMFSTGTNNVPVSTNFILGAGPYGQITAIDTLRNLETYGVGYLPSTLSSLTGQTLSVSQVVASSFVTSNQLFSVQNYLLSTISSTNNDLNTFSSYIVNNLVPSTVSAITVTLSSLNSSFQGYVVGTSITQAQLFSTSAGLIVDTGNQISSYSTAAGVALATTCNYILANTASLSSFSTLSSFVGSTFITNNAAIISTNQNFVALSNYVRLTTGSNSTYLANVSSLVSDLIDEVNALSSLAQDPLTVIGVMSTLNNVRFGSNISISSINSNYKFGISTFTGPSIYMSSATFSSLSAASGYINSFAATTISSAGLLVSSVKAQQIAVNTTASNYTLDVGGSINFTGSMFQNGVLYPATIDVLDILRNSENVSFGSNIMISSINSNVFIRDSTITTRDLSASSINAYDISSVSISTGTVRAGQLSSQQLFTSSILGNTLAVNTLAANDGYFTNTLSSAVILTSSIKGQQIALNRVGSNYTLDVGGSINFTDGLYSNGVLFTGSGSGGSVIGELSTSAAANVWFNNNINVSSINGNLYLSNAAGAGFGLGIGTQTNIPNNGIRTTGNAVFANIVAIGGATSLSNTLGVGLATSLSNTLGVGLATTLSNTLDVIGQATFSNTAVPVRMSNSGSANSIDFSLTGAGGPYITLQSSDLTTGQNYPIIAFSNSATQQRYRLGLGNNSGIGGWTANQLTMYSRTGGGEDITLGIASTGFIGLGVAANTSNRLFVSGTSHITSDFSVGTGATALQNTLYVNDASNSVGINCNAPNSAYVLDVNGDAKFRSNVFCDTTLTAGVGSMFNVKTLTYGDYHVSLNGTNGGASNIILDVGGGVKFHSSISTLYTVQSRPRVWSYLNNSVSLISIGVFAVVPYTFSNYEASNIPTPMAASGNFTAPYTGVYNVSFACQTEIAAGTIAQVVLGTLTLGTLRSCSNASALTDIKGCISLQFIDYIVAGDIIVAQYITTATTSPSFAYVQFPNLQVQYLG